MSAAVYIAIAASGAGILISTGWAWIERGNAAYWRQTADQWRHSTWLADREAATLRQKLTRKPAARAQVQAMRVARTNELASGPVAQLGERAA